MSTLRPRIVRLAVGAALLAAACEGGALTGLPVEPTMPMTSPVVCGGFLMPNPPIDGLPNPEAYTDNGDGTVTDQVTRLVWERTVDPQGYPQLQEVQRCVDKGAGWRLPTRLELLTLVDFSVPAPGPTINAIFGDAPDQVFWTASQYYDNAGDAWVIGFDRGYSDYGVRNNPNLGRCVRAPTLPCGAKRYEVVPDTAQASGLVADHATGLVWQRALDPGSYSYPDALTYCAGLGAGWRVPSLKELQSIVEDTKELPAVDPDAFPDTPGVDFWTSSLDASGSGSAWYVDFFYGASDADVQARSFRVRCVR